MVQSTELPERGIRSALDALGNAQKPGGGVPAYTRWINRRLARFAAAIAYTWGWSPNAVTVASAACSATALALLIALEPSALLGVPVAVLLALGYLLDSADGQVARLSRSGSKQGEWLDHVVDAIRTPTIHLAVLVALWRWTDAPGWLLVIALLYAIASVGQFMSQILAEQLAPDRGRPATTGGALRSVLLLPTDMGTLCWLFIAWGFADIFAVLYTAMFAVNTVYSAVSMHRKYRRLAGLPRPVALPMTRTEAG
jgi:phosphatidylglycerophosphate synthase